MTITIGSSTFDNVLYDAGVNVLYLQAQVRRSQF